MTTARRASPGLLPGAIACILAVVPAVANAQSQWMTRIDLPMEVVRESNPGLSAARRAPVSRYRVNPDVRSSYTDGADEFIGSVGAAIERSTSRDEQVRQDPRLRGEWRHAMPRGSTEVFALYEQAAYRNLEIAETTPFGVDGTRRMAAAGAALNWDLSDASSLGVNARIEHTRFDTPGAADYDLTAAGARYTRSLSDTRAWYVNLDVQQQRPEDIGPAGGADSGSIGSMLGYRVALLEGKMNIDVAAGPLRFNGSSTGSSWQGNVKVTYARAFTDLAFEATRRASPSVLTSSLVAVTVLKLSSKTALGENASVLAEISRVAGNGASSGRESALSLAYLRELSPRLQAALRAERRTRQEAGFGRAQGNLLTVSLTYSHPDL